MDQYSPENNFGIAGKPLQTKAEAQGHVLESFNATNAKAPTLPKSDINQDIEELHKESAIPTLRTYETDVQEAMKHKDTSVVKIALAEKKRQPETVSAAVERATGNIFILITSIVLIVGGLVAIGLLGIFKLKALQPLQTAPVDQSKGILPTDSSLFFVLPPDNTVSHFITSDRARITGSTAGGLSSIILSDSTTTRADPITAETFLSRLPSSAPSWFVRAVHPEFAFGYHNLTNPQPYAIFKIDSYETGFAGMLAWEDALGNDFKQLTFVPLATPIPAVASTTATTTRALVPTPTPFPSVPRFEDAIISNKNVRILKNADGSTAVVYSLIDRQTIVITTSQATLREIMSRLTTTQFVR